MGELFDIKCKHCGAPAGYDIISQSYRCPYCGETSGIEEAQKNADYRRMKREDRTVHRLTGEVTCCPNCGAEIFYEAGDESETCSFCGGKLIRREFEESEDFPEYIIPFVLTKKEAEEELLKWADRTEDKTEGNLIREHAGEIKGYYLPYDLVRGPVSGYVCRENVNREFKLRGYVEQALINTSRQLDNETLDAAEPFDLQALKPFEHGYIAGHQVKLSDLSGAKKERRMLLEAGSDMKPLLEKIFHTEGIRVNMTEGELMEIPVLLPVYVLKTGRRLAVVNGQTGRVAVKTAKKKTRSSKWKVEPFLLCLLVLLSLWLVLRSLMLSVISSIPLLLAIIMQYKDGHFSIMENVIEQGKQKKASRVNKELKIDQDAVINENPFPVHPVFWEEKDGKQIDVTYCFYPWKRVVAVLSKTLILYFLPMILGAVLHYGFGMGDKFRAMGSVIWFWCFGIFCTVYVFSGIRGDAYERPYIYEMDHGKKKLTGKKKSRRLPFFQCIGFDKKTLSRLGEEKKKVVLLKWMLLGVLLVSTFITIF